jgi:hypothetical protein
MSLIDLAFRRTRPGRRPNPLLAIPDLPHEEAAVIAEYVRHPCVSTVTEGKGLDEHVADVIQLVRPRKFVCRCGSPATVLVRSSVRGAEPERYCSDCRPLGILGVVHGGSDGAA